MRFVDKDGKQGVIGTPFIDPTTATQAYAASYVDNALSNYAPLKPDATVLNFSLGGSTGLSYSKTETLANFSTGSDAGKGFEYKTETGGIGTPEGGFKLGVGAVYHLGNDTQFNNESLIGRSYNISAGGATKIPLVGLGLTISVATTKQNNTVVTLGIELSIGPSATSVSANTGVGHTEKVNTQTQSKSTNIQSTHNEQNNTKVYYPGASVLRPEEYEKKYGVPNH